MPELPEVETTTKGLRKTITSLTIKDVWTDLDTKDKRQKNNIANAKYFKVFRKEILNKKILSVERRAKNILINISGEKTILVHLKMTGHLLYGKYKRTSPKTSLLAKEGGRGRGEFIWKPIKPESLNDPYNRFVHFIITFNNGKNLAFSDARKFGKITLLDTKNMHDSKHLKNIGPEPLDKKFTLNNLGQRLNLCMNKKIKTALMDQAIIAGIGNIYSDEILWRAGIHPERKVLKIAESELRLIFKAIKETLAKGIDFGGDSMSDYRNIDGLPGKFQMHHKAYKRTGEKCKRKNCKGIIKRKTINGRSTHFCPMHQK